MHAGARPARPSRLFAILLATAASCGAEPDAPPVELPVDTAGMDPLFLRRLGEAAGLAEEHPRDAAARLGLALLYDANGLTELAARSYEACLELAPDDPRSWYHLGRVRSGLADAEAALAALDRSIELHGDYAPSHWRRGALLARTGRLAPAEEAYLRALELDPGATPAWLGLARIHLERDEPRRAIKRLEALLEQNPRERFANGLLARAHRRLGQERSAERALRREERAGSSSVADPWTVAVRTRAAGVYVVLETATTRLVRGDAAGALAVLEPVYAERPLDLAVVDVMAQALVLEGLHARALEVLDAARSALPEHYKLELDTGRALAAMGEPQRALPHLERAVALNPALAETHTALGEAYFQLGLLAEAEVSFAAALAEGAPTLRDRILLGRTQLDRGRTDAACATLQAATDDYPNSATLWAYLAQAQARSGRVEEARESLRKAAERDPEHDLLETVRASLRALEGEAKSGG